MHNFYRLTLTVGLSLMVAGFATPAAATTSNEALQLCRQRGDDCHAMRVGGSGSDTIILCVNNSSSGNEV